MIKQAYFRGLTKVAGGYAWYNPRTWHARRNPLSGIVNPAVDVVHSITPGGRAQRKLLQGRQLTPAQDKAMQDASSWRNAFRDGFKAWQLSMHNGLTGNLVPGTKVK